MGLSLRQAREDDVDRLIAIHTSAFPDRRGYEARLRNFAGNPRGALGDSLFVMAEGAQIVAHAFVFSLQAWFGGARVPVGGIATVGVAPEARGRGVGSRLLEQLHEVARARGDALGVLYAFRQAFYARMGYGPTTPYRRLRLSPASIPWKPELPVRGALAVDRAAIEACWDAAAARRTGSLVRAEAVWEERLLHDRRVWLVADGQSGVEGYLAWTVSQREAHAKTTLAVDELVARSDAAARSLWAAVGAQRDQVAEVEVDVADDDPIDRALVDPDRHRFGDAQLEHPLGVLAAGPMVRVLDARRALEARGWPADGDLVLQIGEETLRLSVRGGRATATPTGGEPDVRLAPAALAAVAFGALPAAHAARLGWLAARDARALQLAGALLALPAYFSPDPF
jgi:predicted acetyltransferase